MGGGGGIRCKERSPCLGEGIFHLERPDQAVGGAVGVPFAGCSFLFELEGAGGGECRKFEIALCTEASPTSVIFGGGYSPHRYANRGRHLLHCYVQFTNLLKVRSIDTYHRTATHR